MTGAGKGAGKTFPGETMRPLHPFVIAVAIMAAAGVAEARAQDWPTRPVLVVSPFSAGAANEIVARVVLDQVSQQTGQTFVIETRPGGGGIIGVASVVRADPDGYTLLLSSASMSSAVILHNPPAAAEWIRCEIVRVARRFAAHNEEPGTSYNRYGYDTAGWYRAAGVTVTESGPIPTEPAHASSQFCVAMPWLP